MGTWSRNMKGIICGMIFELMWYFPPTHPQSITIHCRSSLFHGSNMCSQSPHCFELTLKRSVTVECELRKERTAVFVSDRVDQLALLGIYKKREIRCISHPVRAQAIVFVWALQITQRERNSSSTFVSQQLRMLLQSLSNDWYCTLMHFSLLWIRRVMKALSKQD